MNARFYALLAIAMMMGIGGGYLLSSTAFQNQMSKIELQLDENDQQIANLQTIITDKETQITVLQETTS